MEGEQSARTVMEGEQSARTVFTNDRRLNGFPGERHISVRRSTGGCSLKITQLKISDSGRFSCVLLEGDREQTRTSILVVINVTEACRSNVTSNALNQNDRYSFWTAINVPPKSVEPSNVILYFLNKDVDETETMDDSQSQTIKTTLTGIVRKENIMQHVCRASLHPNTVTDFDSSTATLDVCTTQQLIVSSELIWTAINVPPKSVEPSNVIQSFLNEDVDETETMDDSQSQAIKTTLTGIARKENITQRVCRASLHPNTVTATLDVCTTQQLIVSRFSLAEPSCPLNPAPISDDKDWFDWSSEETCLPDWCNNTLLEGETGAEKMKGRLYSVDEPVKGHLYPLFTSLEGNSFGSVEATHVAEVVLLGLGVIILLILFIIETVRSTNHIESTSFRKYPCDNSTCSTVKAMRHSSGLFINKSPNIISLATHSISRSRPLLWIAFILCSIAVFSVSVDGFLHSDKRDEFASIGDKVELNCFTNSSRPPKWYLIPYGSNESELIDGSSEEDSNVPNAYRIVNDVFGYSTLVIDLVLLEHAGQYECIDTDEIYKLSVKVTIMDPYPICDQSPVSSPIVCRFHYAGIVRPEFDWLTSGNTTFCNAFAYDSPIIGSLRIKRYNGTPGRCPPEYSEPSLVELSSPLNYAGVEYESVRLSCLKQNDDTGFWFRNEPQSPIQTLIYHQELLRNGLFSVDESASGRSDLLFTSLISTAGKYGCDSMEAIYTAEVVVLDPQPTCLWEKKTGIVNANCSIGFSGNWPPVLEWSKNEKRVEANNTITIPNRRVTIFLIASHDPHDHSFITCSVKFKLVDKPQKTTATNIPKLRIDSCRVGKEESKAGTLLENNEGVPKSNNVLFSESANVHWQTESRFEIVLLGDKVELDCSTNSSRLPEWSVILYGRNEREFIDGSSQADSNVTNPYRIVSDDFGHATLVMDRVLLEHAGTYQCLDTVGKYNLSIVVTVVDPNPVCNHSADGESIACPFHYAGDMKPDVDWLTSENTTFCNESVYDFSTIGSLRVRDYKSPAGRWRCKPYEGAGHSSEELSRPLNMAAVRGRRIRFNCSRTNENTGYWFRKAPLSAEKLLIFHKKTLISDLFKVDEYIPGRFDLTFTSSQRTFGRYGCYSGEATHTAEVILFEGQPSCSGETKDGVVKASCSIRFSGNWPPVIEWQDLIKEREPNDSITKLIPSHSMTTSLFIKLDYDNPKELYYITCSVKLRIEDKPPETTAANVPDTIPFSCRVTIESPDYGNDSAEIDSSDVKESPEHGEAAGAIDADQGEDIGSEPGAGDKGVAKWNDGMAAEESVTTDKPKPNSGNGQGSFVLLQLFLAFIAAYVGIGQF